MEGGLISHFGFTRDEILWQFSWIDLVMFSAPLSDKKGEDDEDSKPEPKELKPDELASFFGIKET